ncbi:cytochrome P450 [Streptomyces sp. NPDC057539]|uniref:cytochrome P450 n=1 Tax=Streptomyces sp. NPDC057539 TaxID=3346159 RepID=UPI0036AF8F22
MTGTHSPGPAPVHAPAPAQASVPAAVPASVPLACPALHERGFTAAARRLTTPDGPALRPVTLGGGLRAWAATDPALARDVLTDPRLTNDIGELGGPVQGFPGRRYPEDFFAHAPQLLSASGERHRGLRRIVAPYFTAAATERTGARLRDIMARIIGSLAGRDRIDLVTDLALPLAGATAGEILGIVPERCDAAVTAALAASGAVPGTEEARSAHRVFAQTVLHIIGAARRSSVPTAATALLDARQSGRIGNAELAGMLGMLLIGTVDSLSTVVPAGALMALRRPEVRHGLGDGHGPAYTTAVTEEILRLNPPFQHTGWRFTRDDCALAGVPLPRGAVVVTSVLAANLHSATWPDPLRADPLRADPLRADPLRADPLRADPPRVDQLRVAGHRRTAAGHLSFGHGPHYCLGAALGRQLVHEALTGLFRRFPRLSLAAPLGELSWHGTCLRRLDRLPVDTGTGPRTGEPDRLSHVCSP